MTRTGNTGFFSDLGACIAFLTILPAGKTPVYSPVGMIRFFPVAGLIIGALLVIVDSLASMLWAAPAAALVDLISLVVITGALHLDGLGDTADGIFSHRGRDRALEIMKDSRTGIMGLVAVFLGLSAKLAGIWSVKTGCSPGEAAAIFLLVPSFSRAAMICAIKTLSYGGQGRGAARDLFARPLGSKDFSLCLIPLGLSLFLGGRGLILIPGFALGCVVILGFYKRTMNCITGDMLGAMTEVMEAWLFMIAGMTLAG